MTNKIRRAALAAALALAAGAAQAQVPLSSVEQIVLYKNAWFAGSGNAALSWRAYDSAYTAQTFYMPFDQLKAGAAHFASVNLLSVWQALSPGGYTGIGLFACPAVSSAAQTDLAATCLFLSMFAANDGGFAVYTPGCSGTGSGPHPCRADLTDVFNNMIDQGTPRYLTIGTFGNGKNGPGVYDVELSVGWGASPKVVDSASYLVQSRNPDGNPATPLRSTDPLTYRRLDFGGFQASDSFLAPDGSAISALTFAPFGPFSAAHGDGGDQYVIEGDTVRAAATQDGGTPGVQYFVGPACGGTGWVMFKTDATSDWRSLVATLSDNQSPSACPPLAQAFTRYTAQTVTYPGLGALPSIISEHYDGPTMAASAHMERFFFARGWGRLAWQAWGKTPATVDLSTRCPSNLWPVDSGWILNDCRIATNIAPADGSLIGAHLWHP